MATKTDFYQRHGLTPDTGSHVNCWGAVHQRTGKYLLQCWDAEKTYIKKEHRTDAALMVVKLLSPQDLQVVGSGAHARSRSITAIRKGALAFVAVSTGTYPNWIGSANIDHVYPVLGIFEQGDETFAKIGPPVPTAEAFRG